MNNTGITVRSMRRADILDGVNQWLQSPADNNKMLTGHLHCAEIVTYRFDSYKDEDGRSRLYLALKTRRGNVEAALAEFDVDKRNGNLYATIYHEYDLAGWHGRGIPTKILRALTPTANEEILRWRNAWVEDNAARAKVQAEYRALLKEFCARKHTEAAKR